MNLFKHIKTLYCIMLLVPLIVGASLHTYLAYRKEPVVYIGLIHSLTGSLSPTEHSIMSFEFFTIDKINKAGGLLGHRIIPIIRDFHGATGEAGRIIQECAAEYKIAAFFDGGSSSTIYALQPIIEKLNSIFFFSQNNIGMITSPNIVFCNSAVNNQVLPAMEESIRLFGKKVFLLGRVSKNTEKSMSLDSTVCHAIVTEYLKMNDFECVGNIFLQDHDKAMLTNAIETIKKAAPSFVLCTSSGELNIDIVNEVHKSGIQTPIVWTRFEFSHLAITGKDKLKTHVFTNSYTRVITTPANQNFVNEISNNLGFAQAISTHEVSALSALQLWSTAVNKCKSFDHEKVRAALRDQIYIETPQGPLTLDPETLYAYKKSVLVRYNPFGVLQFLWYSPYPLKPEPWPTFKPKEYWLQIFQSIVTPDTATTTPDATKIPPPATTPTPTTATTIPAIATKGQA